MKYDIECPKCKKIITISEPMDGNLRNTTVCEECNVLMIRQYSATYTIDPQGILSKYKIPEI